MRKENQRHLVYVLEIVGTYVSSMNSLVSAKEEDPNDAAEHEEEMEQIALLLHKLEQAEVYIPNMKRPKPKAAMRGEEIETMKQVVILSEKIAKKVQKIIEATSATAADSSSG